MRDTKFKFNELANRFRGHNILIVDDDREVLETLNQTLGRAKRFECNISLAENGEEALAELAKRDFSILLSDFKMPKMNGIDLLEIAKEKYPHAIRILITGFSDLKIAREAINRAKIDFYIEKPWNNEELRGMIYEALVYFEFRKRFQIAPQIEKPLRTDFQSPLKPGYLYMVQEKRAERSFKLFTELVTNGYQGLGITTQFPEDVKREYGLIDIPIFWLSKHKLYDQFINANILTNMMFLMRKFIEDTGNSVIILDGLEYLITLHGFKKILLFIQDIYEYNMYNKSNVIAPINPATLDGKELAILERYFEVIEKEVPIRKVS